jgi:hypothetical protein
MISQITPKHLENLRILCKLKMRCLLRASVPNRKHGTLADRVMRETVSPSIAKRREII